ncbi:MULTISPECIES: hypothetical protein [Rhizobium]|uniref:Histidine kinase n=1 Tax=Rhizobium rhododendri TaxID=2506430 RepID=A0ABY8IRW9_9HYPH|nr:MULTISPECIES: hypothetical protein [Rhizobium]WFS26334.1 hypothetical protein PR018_25250 [Rhizobium rhododendri]
MKKLMLILSILVPPALMATSLLVPAFAATQSGLGDLSAFESIAADTLRLVKAGDLGGAKNRITDFETAWDATEPKLYAADKQRWGVIDDAADGAISSLRKGKPDVHNVESALFKLMNTLGTSASK